MSIWVDWVGHATLHCLLAAGWLRSNYQQPAALHLFELCFDLICFDLYFFFHSSAASDCTCCTSAMTRWPEVEAEAARKRPGRVKNVIIWNWMDWIFRNWTVGGEDRISRPVAVWVFHIHQSVDCCDGRARDPCDLYRGGVMTSCGQMCLVSRMSWPCQHFCFFKFCFNFKFENWNLLGNCSMTARKLHWEFFEFFTRRFAPDLLWNCSETALMNRNCTTTALKLLL